MTLLISISPHAAHSLLSCCFQALFSILPVPATTITLLYYHLIATTRSLLLLAQQTQAPDPSITINPHAFTDQFTATVFLLVAFPYLSTVAQLSRSTRRYPLARPKA